MNSDYSCEIESDSSEEEDPDKDDGKTEEGKSLLKEKISGWLKLRSGDRSKQEETRRDRLLSDENIEEIDCEVLNETLSEAQRSHDEYITILSKLSDRAFKLIQTNGIVLGFVLTLSQVKGFRTLLTNWVVQIGIAFIMMSLFIGFVAALQRSTSLGLTTENMRSILDYKDSVSERNFDNHKQVKAWLIYLHSNSVLANSETAKSRSKLVDLSMFIFLLGAFFLVVGVFQLEPNISGWMQRICLKI
jgi:hypothetical protein